MEWLKELSSLLEYDPDSGSLKWHPREGRAIFNSRFAGKEAGNTRTNRDGHKSVQLTYKRRSIQANKLIWFVMTGKVPDFEVDHVDGDGWSNKWLNLRKATANQNCYNRGRRSDSKTGYKGVAIAGKKFRAAVTAQKVRYELGLFDTPEEAHEAYCKAAKELHGDFANFG